MCAGEPDSSPGPDSDAAPGKPSSKKGGSHKRSLIWLPIRGYRSDDDPLLPDAKIPDTEGKIIEEGFSG
jgi:hypothetical protein